MKKRYKNIISLLICLVMFLPTFATGCVSSTDEDEVKTDKTKTQLYVHIHDGGFGAEWFSELTKDFESKYANYQGKEGKVGVQIIPDATKNTLQTVSDVTGSINEVIFTEQFSDYIEYVNQGAFLDITDVVTKEVKGEKTETNPTGSILGRFTEEQKEFYCVNGKYYAIPHYEKYYGFTIDLDVFERAERNGALCLYLDDNGNFITDSINKELRSKGPDNIKGTYDDGLPATYDQFFKVLDKMVATNITPIIWSGNSKGYYTNYLTYLEANAIGFDDYKLYYSMNGMAHNIVDSITEGSDFESTVVNVKEQSIDESNAYLLYGSSGRYYASKFFEKIITNYNKYLYKDSFLNSDYHTDAQYNFINSKYDSTKKRIGMILEGIWWENEAENRFNDMENTYGEEASRQGRNFAFIPVPVPTKLKDGETHKNIIPSKGDTLAFINANIADDKVELAKAFLELFYTTEELNKFTAITGTSIGLKYDVSDETMNKLSPYSRSVITVKNNSDILYQYSQNRLYVNNVNTLLSINTWDAVINNSTVSDMMETMRYSNVTALEYFNGIKEKHNKTWWDTNIYK